MEQISLYWESVLAGAPHLVSQLGATAAILIVSVAIYERITPYREIRLIRDGNIAAAIALAGFVVGMALALAAALEHSVSVVDVVVWGSVAALLQFLSFAIVAATHPGFAATIIGGNVAAALFLAACHIAAGLLVAASVST